MAFFMCPIFAATALALSLAACSEEKTATPPAESKPAEQAVQTQTTNLPVYKIRTANQPYPPFNIFNADNTISGLEKEILDAIAQNQNIKIEHVPYVWDLIFKDLDKENVAMVGGGLAKGDFDEEVVVLSQAYMRSPDCVAVSSDSNLANWQKKPIALVEVDEVDEDMINNFGVDKNNIVHVRSQYQGLQEVLSGQVASTMSDCYVLRYYINQSFQEHKSKFILKELPSPDGDEGYNLVLGVRKDQTELLEKINQGIANIKANGELDKILQNWQ